MKQRRFLILIVVIACVTIAHASPLFVTKRLDAICKATKLNLPDSIGTCTNNDSTWAYNGRVLRVCTNEFGDVSHIGYKLFANEQVQMYKPQALLYFLERYILELDLNLDKKSTADRMAIDKVTCTEGSTDLFGKLAPECPSSFENLKETVGRMFRVTWTIGAKKLALSFPANYQLMIGADIVELEDIFERNIKRIVPIAGEDIILSWDTQKVAHADNYLIMQGGEYLNPAIRADIYLKKLNGKNMLITDSKKPVLSITNILLTGLSDYAIPLHLTIKRYGNKNTTAEITLQQFIGLCHLENCKLYVGVKTNNKEEVTATIFALNSDLAYNHVMAVTIPVDVLSKGSKAAISGTVYTYIPLQNVTEKFFTNGFTHTAI